MFLLTVLLSSIFVVTAVFFSIRKGRKAQEDQMTSIGLSPVTLKEMHEHLKEVTGDNDVTSEWQPVNRTEVTVGFPEDFTLHQKIRSSLLLFLIIMGSTYSVLVGATSAVYAIKYSIHISRICEVRGMSKGGEVYGYQQGVYSNHPWLVQEIGEDVPKVERIKNGKELCGHD